jgi:hypothetical protein
VITSHDRIARRRAEEERGDTLFVPERRRSSRLQSAIRAERAQRAEQSKPPHGSDKPGAAVQVGMIAYAGEGAVLHDDPLS